MVLLLAAALFLFGPMAHRASGQDDGILYRMFQRMGGGRAPKPK